MITVPVPKGTDINIDVVGLHYNRTYQHFKLIPTDIWFKCS
jgi:hypothetical protein